MRVQVFILWISSYILYTVSVTVYPPVWVTSNYIKSASYRIVDAATTGQKLGPSQTPTATMPFPGAAFSLTPNIGYGISGYEGTDSLYSEKFQINMTGITTSSFSVKIQISGTTDIYTLQIRYLAVDKLFPHHLNSFDNVPVNYMNGALINLTVKSDSLQYYTNTINYTAQAIADGLTYKQFQPPLSDNKILLFMTSLFIEGDNIQVPANLQVTATIQTNQTYKLSVNFGYRCKIDRLHFSMIMFDQYDVQKSGKYLIVYQRINFPQPGGFYAFQSQFINNFMIGLTDIGAPRILSLIYFYSNFVTQSGIYGVRISQSITKSWQYSACNRYGVSIFYLKTWICPTQSFFDPLTNQCIGCSLPYCIDCQSLTTCNKCDIQSDYLLNTTTGLCYTCGIKGCINCTSIQCINCNQQLNYILVANGTCQRCNTQLNYFINITIQQCQLCMLDHCLNCTNLQQCTNCDINSSYYRTSGNLCQYCNNSMNYFINLTNLQCQPCKPTNCIQCQSLIQCRVCDQNNMYLLNITDGLCYLCTLSNCLECQTFTECRVCDQQNRYYLNQSNKQCQLCVLEGCINCTSLQVCAVCDIQQDYGHDFMSINMTLCGKCNVSCVCDGYGLPWNSIQLKCTGICGDGLIRVDEECDDNNTESGDGCSSKCMQEQYYNCTGEPSNCTQTLFIQAQFIGIQKQGCNGFKVTTKTPEFTLLEITENIFILNQGVKIVRVQQNQSYIEIHAEYMRDIVDEKIVVHFAPGQKLTVNYNPTVPALYYTRNQCLAEQQIQKMMEATQIISYVILIISILSCKIVGLELFGVLQLSYFTLSSHSFLNVYLAPLTKFRTFNGLNVGLTSESAELPGNYQQMGVAGSFINNCNVMLFVLFGELVLAILFYLLTRILRNSKLEKMALRLLKQGFITLVLFNIFNISFSAGVHWEYAEPSDPWYIISSIILFGTIAAMIISVTAMQLTSTQDYGQYKNKFKLVWICQFYIPLQIIFRMFLGFYMGLQSHYLFSTLIMLGFSLAFMLYIIINLPFLSVYQNYRSVVIHLTMLVTLLTANYYSSMKSNTPMQIKGKIFTPAIIQLILIEASLVISICVLFHQLYTSVRQWQLQHKTLNIQRNITEQSIGHLG